MDEDDFKVVIRTTRNSELTITKGEMLLTEDGKYLFTVDTSVLGTGEYYVLTYAYVPDTDFDDGEVVVDGDNTESKWVYVCGRTIDRSPQSDSESLVTSGGLYGALETKADVSDLDGYINNCQYNNDTDNIELMHDDKVICTVGVGKAITTAMQSLVERVALIESRYVYEE